MGYASRGGKRPMELASKSSHSYIINDPDVRDFIKDCNPPEESENIIWESDFLIELEPLLKNPIEHVVAIDGGYTESFIKRSFPSSSIAFFQFGALFLSYGL